MERLLPDPGPTTIAEQLGALDLAALAGPRRPYVFMNFVETIDGHATIDGRSGKIGSDADLEMLLGLRSVADGVMVGAGTLRAERYGRIIARVEVRAERERRGMRPDPVGVVISERLELPWDIPLFTNGSGEVVVFTASDAEPPETATPVRLVRHRGGVDMSEALRLLRAEHGVRSLLCEGGPHLHGSMLSEGLVDELFVTLGPRLAGGSGPRITEGPLAEPADLTLRWILREGDELFVRYAVVH